MVNENPQITQNALAVVLQKELSAHARDINALLKTEGIPVQSDGWMNGKIWTVSSGKTLNLTDLIPGYSYSIYNDSGSSITITQGSGVTLRLAGTATTGSRTLAQYGLATFCVVSSTTAVGIGAGLS